MYNHNNLNQNSDHHYHHHKTSAAPMSSPRISFSNDFAESAAATSSHHHYQQQQIIKNYRDAPVSSDFEFCVSNYSSSMTMSADELFSKGKLLPYKETNCPTRKPTTLKDELLVEDNDDFSKKPPKSPTTRWKGILGLRKSHIGSKKVDKNERDELHPTKNSIRDALHGGGTSSSFRDTEFRFN